MESNENFNDVFREKSKQNALEVIKLFQELKHREELRIIGKQLMRSSTSVAANFRAACRARSSAEHYSKLCIVVEECDETLFWLELIEATRLVSSEQLKRCQEETRKLLMVFAKTRKKLKPPPKP
ncbi:MAG: four helix bundle protein [Bacteroidia bacterium]|nr:four helix bundle protein [Bacteroidia bacterium]